MSSEEFEGAVRIDFQFASRGWMPNSSITTHRKSSSATRSVGRCAFMRGLNPTLAPEPMWRCGRVAFGLLPAKRKKHSCTDQARGFLSSGELASVPGLDKILSAHAKVMAGTTIKHEKPFIHGQFIGTLILLGCLCCFHAIPRYWDYNGSDRPIRSKTRRLLTERELESDHSRLQSRRVRPLRPPPRLQESGSVQEVSRHHPRLQRYAPQM
jgi:hypothetical protein